MTGRTFSGGILPCGLQFSILHFLTNATLRQTDCLQRLRQEAGLGRRQPHLVAAGSKVAHKLPDGL